MHMLFTVQDVYIRVCFHWCMRRAAAVAYSWQLQACTDLLQLHFPASMSAGAADSAEGALSTEGLDDWILSNLDQPTLRRARVSALVQAAQPFQYQQSEVLMVIGSALSTSVK
jgi:hypothetical protein